MRAEQRDHRQPPQSRFSHPAAHLLLVAGHDIAYNAARFLPLGAVGFNGGHNAAGNGKGAKSTAGEHAFAGLPEWKNNITVKSKDSILLTLSNVASEFAIAQGIVPVFSEPVENAESDKK